MNETPEQHNSAPVDSLKEMKITAQGILGRLNGADPGDVQAAMKEYTALVDRFYQVSEYLAPQQYRAAKQDFEYFMRLLELAIQYFGTSGKGSRKSSVGMIFKGSL
jgi:hypothetical protein